MYVVAIMKAPLNDVTTKCPLLILYDCTHIPHTCIHVQKANLLLNGIARTIVWFLHFRNKKKQNKRLVRYILYIIYIIYNNNNNKILRETSRYAYAKFSKINERQQTDWRIKSFQFTYSQTCIVKWNFIEIFLSLTRAMMILRRK